MGQDSSVRIKTLGQESGGLSSCLVFALNQVCDREQGSTSLGPRSPSVR